MKTVHLVILALLPAALAAQQNPQDVQRVFEAGQYQQVIDAAAENAAPEVVFLAAESYQKLGMNEMAIQTYERLAQRPEDDAWHFIGTSGRQLVEGQLEPAIDSARHAVEMLPERTEVHPEDAWAHFQLGLALARQQRWVEAAAAFDAAAERQPTMAYAHYYGGLMQYRAKRSDLMAIRFNHFLTLAPKAPERPEVLSIMRTLRRR